MSQAIVDELKQENLCTYFILPLLRLNKDSFLKANFVDSYLTRDGRHIIVYIVEVQLVNPAVFILHSQYCQTVVHDKGMYIVYKIDPYWQKDIELFMEGKYSEMSRVAKDHIIRYSGLSWNEYVGEVLPVSDIRLLALDRHILLKEMWERIVQDDDDVRRGLSEFSGELLSVPGESSYIDLDKLAQP